LRDPGVSTFGLTAGPQLITALSEGRGYGEAGGEGLFASWQISESLTHRFAVPPSPATGRGLLSVDISLSEQNVQTRGVGQAPYPSPAERDRGPALRDQRGQDARTTAGETLALPGQASIDPDHLTSPGMALGKRRVMLGLLCPQPSRRKVTNHRPADVVRKRIPTNTRT